METIKLNLTTIGVKCETRALKYKYTREMSNVISRFGDINIEVSKELMKEKINKIFT